MLAEDKTRFPDGARDSHMQSLRFEAQSALRGDKVILEDLVFGFAREQILQVDYAFHYYSDLTHT